MNVHDRKKMKTPGIINYIEKPVGSEFRRVSKTFLLYPHNEYVEFFFIVMIICIVSRKIPILTILYDGPSFSLKSVYYKCIRHCHCFIIYRSVQIHIDFT